MTEDPSRESIGLGGPVTDYEKLLNKMDPKHVAIFKKILPEGVDNPELDPLSWNVQFEEELNKVIKYLPEEEQTIIKGYAALIRKYYNRNCIALKENDRAVKHAIEGLPSIENDDKSIEITYSVGNAILNQFRFKTMEDTKEIYRYDVESGVWVPDGSVFIETAIKQHGLKLSHHQISEVIYHVQTSTYEPRENFLGAIIGNMLHVNNGWLNMDTLELEPHTDERLSITKLPTDYDPKAAPVEFIKVIIEALELEYRKVLFKVMGNMLVPDCRFEKATMFVGDGHNRKSTILVAMREVIGQENCSSVSLQELAEDKFASADLYGKLANIVYDLKAEKIASTGRFKEIVSGDPIRAQKKHKPAFVFRPIAKIINSANQIPQADDNSNAYMRRWVILPFYRTFDRDATIQERLLEEKSGILKLMLAGRKLLLSEGFDEIPLEKIRSMYNKNASLVKDFVDEYCILDIDDVSSENRTKTDNMQEAYYSFVKSKKRGRDLSASEKDFASRHLGEELQKLGVERKHIRQKGTSERPYFYLGIRLKSEARDGSEDINKF